MIEEIYQKQELIALIIRANYKNEGYRIEPHIHLSSNRVVTKTQEVLFIKSGKVQIEFYDNNMKFIENKTVTAGDIIFLSSGGHGFLMLEKSEIIEVKQGPYLKEDDKLRF